MAGLFCNSPELQMTGETDAAAPWISGEGTWQHRRHE